MKSDRVLIREEFRAEGFKHVAIREMKGLEFSVGYLVTNADLADTKEVDGKRRKACVAVTMSGKEIETWIDLEQLVRGRARNGARTMKLFLLKEGIRHHA